MLRGADEGLLVPGVVPLCQLVAVDWLQAEERVEHLGERPLNLVQVGGAGGRWYLWTAWGGGEAGGTGVHACEKK